MNPENMNAEALSLFNSLNPETQQEALMLTESISENEAVYLAAMRRMPEMQKRKLLFLLSRQRWGL